MSIVPAERLSVIDEVFFSFASLDSNKQGLACYAHTSPAHFCIPKKSVRAEIPRFCYFYLHAVQSSL